MVMIPVFVALFASMGGTVFQIAIRTTSEKESTLALDSLPCSAG